MRRTLFHRRDRRTGRPSAKWTIGYQLADGRMAYEVAFTDKQASEHLLKQREAEVARGEVGLRDPFDEQKRRPIAEHVADYLAAMRGAARTAEHVRRTKARLARAFTGASMRTIADLSPDRVATWANSTKLAEGLSAATRNHLLGTLRAFSAWLAKMGRLPSDPLVTMQVKPATDADRTLTSRVLRVAELRRLVEAAPLKRQLLYLFAGYTGFRRGEDAATTWADLDLDGEFPRVRIRGANAKNKTTVHVPIPGWLADRLRQHRGEATMRAGGKLQLTAPVFHVPAAIVRQLRQDAARAGLGTVRKVLHKTEAGNVWTSVDWCDPSGPEVDLRFHGFRSFYATTLFEAGVPIHEVQKLCRHASIATTIRHYTAWRQPRLDAAAARLADPMSTAPGLVASSPAAAAAVRSSPPDRKPEGGQSLVE